MSQTLEVFRIDGHTPASKRPYRAAINGKVLRGEKGGTYKFATIEHAAKFVRGYAAMNEWNARFANTENHA